jgi:MFS family permease
MSQSVDPEDGVRGLDPVETQREPQRAPQGSLWRDRNFLTMWTGQSLSQFGEQISMLAIPVLAVLLLKATSFELGLLNAADTAAFLVVGLPAGAWIDRMRKRHVMIAADIVRALALATIPLLWMLGALQMWHVYVVALVVGIATVFFVVSYQSLIPSLVPTDRIGEANGKFETTSQLAHLVGPAFAGWLIGILTAPVAMIATACTYAASFTALSLTKDHEQRRAAEDHAPIMTEIGEGLRWVFGNPLLRRIVGTTSVSNLFSTISYTMLPLFLLRELGFTPQGMGLIFSLGAIGGLLGATATPHIARRVGEARAIPLSAIAFSVVALFLPVAAMVPAIAFPLLVVQGFISSFTVLVYNITQVTFRQRITPPRLLGRMNASIRFVVWGVMPIGALVAGGLGTWLGVVPTMWIGAIGDLLSATFVVVGPFWALRRLPDAPDAADA